MSSEVQLVMHMMMKRRMNHSQCSNKVVFHHEDPLQEEGFEYSYHRMQMNTFLQ